MKLKHVVIKNFKGVRDVEFPSDAAPHALRSVTALLGDNGSGKTSVLQAIALTLSMATRRTRDMASFNWHGFLPERVPSLGPTFVELEVAFEQEEVDLTYDLFLAWQESLPSDRRQTWRIVPPSRHSEVTLRFEQGRINSLQGFEGVNQFLGLWYIKTLKDARPDLKDSFAKLGDVFWFDQHRNLGTRHRRPAEGHDQIRVILSFKSQPATDGRSGDRLQLWVFPRMASFMKTLVAFHSDV